MAGAGPTTLEDLFAGFTNLSWEYQLMAMVGLYALLMGAMRPFQEFLQSVGFEAFPTVPPSPAVLADAVVRQMIDPAEAEKQATRSGIAKQWFDLMVQVTGQAPSPQMLIDAYHRGLIGLGGPEIGPAGTAPADLTVAQGIAEGHIADKWIPVIQGIATILPSIGQAVMAAVRSQLTMPEAQALYQKVGGAPEYFKLLYDIAGNPPSALEAAVLVHRGIIPQHGTGPDVLSFDQAVAEGDTKNKWGPAIWELSKYYPPPRTITTLIRHAAITDEQALHYLAMAGVPQDIAAMYVHEGHTAATATSKHLAETTTHALYTDQLIDAAAARQLIEALGYSQQDADFMLSVWDLQLYEASLKAAVTRVRSLYLARKINSTTATHALNQLAVPAGQVGKLIGVWELERGASVAIPTRAEIVDAVKYELISPQDAMAELQALGYSEYDAWLVMAVGLHGAPIPPPAKTPIIPEEAPVEGGD